jgi:hypothetical protein
LLVETGIRLNLAWTRLREFFTPRSLTSDL